MFWKHNSLFLKTKCFYGGGGVPCFLNVVPFLAFSALPFFKSGMNPVTHGVNMGLHFFFFFSLAIMHVLNYHYLVLARRHFLFIKKEIYFFNPVKIYFCFQPTILNRISYNIFMLCLSSWYYIKEIVSIYINWHIEYVLVLNYFQNVSVGPAKISSILFQKFFFYFFLVQNFSYFFNVE